MSRPRHWAIALTFFLMLGCSGSGSRELVLYDFESDAELDGLHWKCHVLYSFSSEHVTHGASSLRMELYPSEYPGMSPALKTNDWRGFKTLCFDVYNPGVKDLKLTLRIDDKKEANEYGDRYNGSFIVKPGWNRLERGLENLLTSGTKRNLELSTIHRFLLFMVRPPEKTVLYVDYVRLTSKKAGEMGRLQTGFDMATGDFVASQDVQEMSSPMEGCSTEGNWNLDV